jgi:hypothetical protein
MDVFLLILLPNISDDNEELSSINLANVEYACIFNSRPSRLNGIHLLITSKPNIITSRSVPDKLLTMLFSIVSNCSTHFISSVNIPSTCGGAGRLLFLVLFTIYEMEDTIVYDYYCDRNENIERMDAI